METVNSQEVEWNAGWTVPKAAVRDMSLEEHHAYLEVNQAVLDYARQHKLTRANISERSGIASGTLYDFLAGKYKGVYTGYIEKLRNWLNAEAEAAAQRRVIINEPPFLDTPSSRKIIAMLRYAQTGPTMITVTFASGTGKTKTAEHYAATTPGVTYTCMRKTISTPQAAVIEIAKKLNINARSHHMRMDELLIRLRRNGRHTLLILDEAQFLSDDAVEELRSLKDTAKCGLALLGNDDLIKRYGGQAPKEGYGQLHSRFGARPHAPRSEDEDISLYIAGWGFTDRETVRLLTAIGHKPGALRQIEETVKLASLLADGRDGQLTAEDIRKAWKARGGENL